MDLVFRALADPGRRALLDRLADTDGLSVGELCEVLSEMTRFGVMKHLSVLEQAHLITTERHGRRKLHYLNPVPIQEIQNRWISRYAAPFTAALADLATDHSADHPNHNPSDNDKEQRDGRTEARVRDLRQGHTA